MAERTRGLKAAIIGAGLMGRWHAHAINHAGGQVVAVVDPDSVAADSLSRRHGGRTYLTLEALLSEETFDVAHVCSPSDTHEAVILECLKAGVAALVEKPLAPSASVTEKLLVDAQSKGKKIWPTHQYAFQRSVQDLADNLPKLGSLVAIDFFFQTAGGGEDKTLWAQTAADILPHPISVLQRLLGSDGIAEADWNFSSNGSGSWQLTSVIGGALVRIFLSVEARPTRAGLVVTGVEGTFEADLFHDYGIWSSGHVSKRSKITAPLSRSARHFAASTINLAGRLLRGEPAYPGLISLVQAFYRSEGPDGPIDADDILQAAVIRDWFLSSEQASGPADSALGQRRAGL